MVSLNTEVLGLGVIQEEGVLFYSVCMRNALLEIKVFLRPKSFIGNVRDVGPMWILSKISTFGSS